MGLCRFSIVDEFHALARSKENVMTRVCHPALIWGCPSSVRGIIPFLWTVFTRGTTCRNKRQTDNKITNKHNNNNTNSIPLIPTYAGLNVSHFVFLVRFCCSILRILTQKKESHRSKPASFVIPQPIPNDHEVVVVVAINNSTALQSTDNNNKVVKLSLCYLYNPYVWTTSLLLCQ